MSPKRLPPGAKNRYSYRKLVTGAGLRRILITPQATNAPHIRMMRDTHSHCRRAPRGVLNVAVPEVGVPGTLRWVSPERKTPCPAVQAAC